MIRFKTGNILAEDTEALFDTVNCAGFMGRGIALQFKKAFPANFAAYAAACKRGEVKPGRMFVFETDALAEFEGLDAVVFRSDRAPLAPASQRHAAMPPNGPRAP